MPNILKPKDSFVILVKIVFAAVPEQDPPYPCSHRNRGGVPSWDPADPGNTDILQE